MGGVVCGFCEGWIIVYDVVNDDVVKFILLFWV